MVILSIIKIIIYDIIKKLMHNFCLAKFSDVSYHFRG